MRIGFIDPSDWDYHVGSVDQHALGGSQSAACYLARTLVRKGHDVFYFNSTLAPGMHDGVDCRNWHRIAVAEAHALALDAVVCLLVAGLGRHLREIFAPKAMVLWNQHAHDQPAVQALRDPAEREAYDGFAMVSDWQRGEFAHTFGIDPGRMVVLRNAIAPTFAGLFPGGQSILAQKATPPILVYTSTPFRGLDLLLAAWPTIRTAVPDARLQVFSSMSVYHTSTADDEAAYGRLYRLCRETPGIEYFGSIPQPQLAIRLRAATMLAYPNTFPETSCIAVIEAMASGCRIVTSNLGALPETTAGFASLISGDNHGEAWLQQFSAEVVRVLGDQASRPAESELLLRRQVAHVNAACSWIARADEWVAWLATVCGESKPQRPRGLLALLARKVLRLSKRAPEAGDT